MAGKAVQHGGCRVPVNGRMLCNAGWKKQPVESGRSLRLIVASGTRAWSAVTEVQQQEVQLEVQQGGD